MDNLLCGKHKNSYEGLLLCLAAHREKKRKEKKEGVGNCHLGASVHIYWGVCREEKSVTVAWDFTSILSTLRVAWVEVDKCRTLVESWG